LKKGGLVGGKGIFTTRNKKKNIETKTWRSTKGREEKSQVEKGYQGCRRTKTFKRRNNNGR